MTGWLRAGDPVTCELTKWDGARHWRFAGRFLGTDRHGDWVGYPAATRFDRPGATYVAPVAQVGLVPGPGLDHERGFLATFHAPGGPVAVYVDVTTPAAWDGAVLRAVDLDLDVVCGTDGRVWVEDEEEFSARRSELGYPDAVVAHARASCERAVAALRARTAPYDGTAAGWLARLAELGH